MISGEICRKASGSTAMLGKKYFMSPRYMPPNQLTMVVFCTPGIARAGCDAAVEAARRADRLYRPVRAGAVPGRARPQIAARRGDRRRRLRGDRDRPLGLRLPEDGGTGGVDCGHAQRAEGRRFCEDRQVVGQASWPVAEDLRHPKFREKV